MIEVDIRHRQGDFTLEAAFASDARVTALFGPSGAGKSTLVAMIAGLIRPDRGRIAVNGTVLVDTARGVFVPPHRRRMAVVFQDTRLFPHLTVRQNLNYGRWFAPRDGTGEALDGIAARLGIGHLLGRWPARLSGGEKQRVAIGRALLSNPRLLLMDEPLSGLDEARKAEILPYLEGLAREAAMPIVYVSHVRQEVERLGGQIVPIGTPAEIARQTQPP